ncbi:MAG TPA: IS110 family transposase [Arachidicoccus sp.]|nr:IS110 family transposase [Arachidicoccus sp.]
MKKIVKQVVGIDVAQKELVVCLGRMLDDFSNELYAHKTFANTAKGFSALLLWVKKFTTDAVPVRYVMEATGVYHESLAYFLDAKGYELSIILPNKISNYFRTLDIKTITDKTASEAIALFGLERKLQNWNRPKTIFKKMKQLTRERDQIVQERTMVKNQLHAEQAEAEPNKSTVARIKQRILFLNKQEKAIKEEIAVLIRSEKELKDNIELICSISGIGVLTAATVLAETNGFELIRNKRQLASYAGFDIKEKQSGTSVKGKPRISKHGNKYLRKCMHLPALSAIRHDDHFKTIFVRLVSKHGVKMKGAVAVQRKLLEMTYTIFKTKKKYDKSYLSRTEQEYSQQEMAMG